MTGRKQSAADHLRIVGRDIHRYTALGRMYGMSSNEIDAALSDGIRDAEQEVIDAVAKSR